MALDVYVPCPCGSGKKLKFCCLNIADEMDRISRLIENNQSRQALHQLEAVQKKHPDNAWVATTQAIVQIETGEFPAAQDTLRSFLERHPEQEFATVLYATAVLQNEGLDSARKPVHRAFQRCAKKFPSMVGGLAGAMAALFHARGHMLAAREHLVLSMRFVPDKDRQEIFVRLLDFDNDEAIPYPLRSVHPLPQIPGGDELTAEVKKALKYAAVGCWDTSAELLTKLTEAHGNTPELWHALGLCHAWDGQEEPAAKALHRAAQLYPDRGVAVDCETLAQLLDWNTAPERRRRLNWNGTISSVGKLLSTLDAVPRLFRLQLPPQGSNGEPMPTAIYQGLDRAMADCPPAESLTTATVPNVIAQVFIEDADPETHEPAEITIVGLAGDAFDEVVALVRTACGDAVIWEPEAEESGWVPEETLVLSWQWAFPHGMPVAARRKLELERWRHTTQEVWPQHKLRALQGRTPQEAAGDPAASTALTAAVYVLDAQCLRGGFELDVSGMFARLHIEPLPPVAVTPETPLNAFTPLQWLRLPLAQLSDEQMLSAVNRALLVHHDRFLYEALCAAVQRPDCLAELDQVRVYQTLADLCRKHDRREESFRWIAAGRQHAQQQPNSFEQVWSWDLRELLARLENPQDEALKPLLDKFVSYYTPKLPQMRPYLEEILSLAGLPSPFTSSLVTGAGVASTGGGLWTPDAPGGEPVGAGKLWLPGS